MKFALGIEYDGNRFHGWQRQDNARSVQECLEAAISKVANELITVQCAGRTDTGVHALGQVVHFDSTAIRDNHQWVQGCNTNLPEDISVLWAHIVSDDFHARFSALSRTYRYVILNRKAKPAIMNRRFTWQYHTLDVERMQSAAKHLIGKHDFSSYRAINCQSKTAIRDVRHVEVQRHGEQIIIEVTANAFLMHMVRNFAGVLMAIGMGKEDAVWAREVLEFRDRTKGGVTAPPDGLYLVNVDYPVEYDIPCAWPQPWQF